MGCSFLLIWKNAMKIFVTVGYKGMSFTCQILACQYEIQNDILDIVRTGDEYDIGRKNQRIQSTVTYDTG